ncbi:MAG: hypothetical protein ACLQVL_28945 [Terriglobia bacterium]
MTSAICTLFEGDYHYGLGALCNSLYQRGYRGVVYAGYRGQLPPWAGGIVQQSGYSELSVQPQFKIRFVPLTTEIHLTNYKPDFMLSIWHDHCPDADALFYFDPDITVICRWPFFEEWVGNGVAVCGDVNADMPASHPLRHAWMRYFGSYGLDLAREQSIYFSGGFVGVAKEHVGFLGLWQRLIQLLKPAIGELQKLGYSDRTALICFPDQDALNVATMACEEPISCVGRDGMDFQWGGGGYIMSHAVGDVKPWRKKMLWSTLAKGQRPGRADKAFLRHASSPIRLYGPLRLGLRKLDMLAGSALGRYLH